MPLVIYGIANCSTVKKAITYLQELGFSVTLYDYKIQGIELAWLNKAYTAFGNKLLNKQSLTWRKLTAEQQANLDNKDKLFKLFCTYPTLIKRPIILQDQYALLGFDYASYQKLAIEYGLLAK